MKKTVAVHLAEGFEEIEAISIIDVLRRAQIDTRVISVTGKKEVTGAHAIQIIADCIFEETDYNSVGMIVLPGGMPGTTNLKNHAGLREQILSFHEKGKPLGAICAAPLVFGNLGILRDQRATCFPGFEEQLNGATVTGAEVETSGKIITGKGAGVAIKFALKIVETIKGKALADELAEKMIAN
ncbi:4-methyl-5(b-hydroxyethyl)-thiazole monophosphate biosynthesis [Mariniphaga anaerophila]|uniref:4-methyl-5(B-hydroxyethyl)-thiazole monophosphate biosynthesis n=1 Tax=Mariniphaga anaerophila TaxID=1484053 RepID=A0A1M5ETW4_9BACT|nr:DJ-1 family glyoxalase III [Mariniphaga anaerophila]SHF82637.1 4-methyl-5(b-hydroxyethyl)-thiazole monophosphate biosynthesis [Mariniphaga anaerophila]